MELHGSDKSASATSSDTSSSSTTTTSNSANHSSIRDLDELLMGGNDLDALPFEFGCDFSGAFEDKYVVPPLSVSTASRLVAMNAESGFDILPPLALLSPPTHFYLNSPPSRFLHADQDYVKSLSCSRSSVLSFDRRSDAATSRASSAASHSALAESLSSGVGNTPSSTPDGSEYGDQPAVRGGKSTHIGRWTKKEHELFLEGLKLYGKSWKKISSLVVTRTLVQIRTHAQKFLQKQAKYAQKAAVAAAAAAASGDAAPPLSTSNKATRHYSQRLDQSFGDHLETWRGAPICFPELLSASPAFSSSSTMDSFTRTTASSPYILSTLAKRDDMCKLDQLLHDELSQYADGHYQSPMGTDDEILQPPMYAQWLRSDSYDGGGIPSLATQALSSSSSASMMLSLPSKRRRNDPLQPLVNPMEAMSSSVAVDSAHQPHASGFGLGRPHSQPHTGTSTSTSTSTSLSLFNNDTMDFAHHTPPHQLHAYAPSPSPFADSNEYDNSTSTNSGSGSHNYSSWQLP